MSEVFKPIPGYEGLYDISENGRVISLARVVIRRNGSPNTVTAKDIKPRLDKRGYLMTSLAKGGVVTNHPIHHLMALAFIGPRPEGLMVAHYNGIKTDNHWANIRYATRQENADDAVRLGEMRRGEDHHFAKLDAEKVRTIRAATGSQSAIAARFGVNQTLISQIKRRKIWTHVV